MLHWWRGDIVTSKKQINSSIALRFLERKLAPLQTNTKKQSISFYKMHLKVKNKKLNKIFKA